MAPSRFRNEDTADFVKKTFKRRELLTVNPVGSHTLVIFAVCLSHIKLDADAVLTSKPVMLHLQIFVAPKEKRKNGCLQMSCVFPQPTKKPPKRRLLLRCDVSLAT
jgi:hypothetical protein